MDIRKSIVTRIAIIYLALLIFSLVVMYQMISVQQIENSRW